jgi:hypothetical protein
MRVAEIEELAGIYYFDLFGAPDEVNQIPPRYLQYLKAFLIQADEWTEIKKTGKLPEPVRLHLAHTGIIKPGERDGPIRSLLERNCEEWLQIASEGRRRGYSWANLLAPARSSAAQGVSHVSA